MTDGDAPLREAAAIGDQLAASAIWHRGRCTWVSRSVGARSQAAADAPPALRSLDAAVFGGTAGIALFLARLAGATGNGDHRRAALGAIRHAIDVGGDASAARAGAGRRSRFGFYQGQAGIAWAACEVGRALGEPALEREGRRIAGELAGTLRRHVAPDDHDVDVIAGAAGGIPALLDLAARGAPRALELAEGLGARLLRVAHVEGERWSWTSPADPAAPARNGFSHGAAGIAWALGLLHEATGREAFLDAARGALAFERATFDPRQGNWPLLSEAPGPDGRRRCWAAWCYGAGGVGLARARTQGPLRDAAVQGELRAARAALRARLAADLQAPGRDMTLCHGVLGAAECLALVEEGLGGDDPHRPARGVAAWALDRFGTAASAREGLALDWPTLSPSAPFPGLLKGLAGIGHAMLRLHDPRVPSVLVPASAAAA